MTTVPLWIIDNLRPADDDLHTLPEARQIASFASKMKQPAHTDLGTNLRLHARGTSF